MATEIPRTSEQSLPRERVLAGLFREDNEAQNAIEALKGMGLSARQIGVASSEKHEKKHFWEHTRKTLGSRDESTTSSEFHDVMRTEGLSEDQARHFGSQLHDGKVLVMVHSSPEHESEVQRVLQENGGDLRLGPTSSLASPTPSTLNQAAEEGGERHIQLLGEKLRVSKEKIARGEVTLRKEVITEPQHIEVPLTREEVVIERHAPTGAAPETQIGKEESIRIPVSEERVKVEKLPEVREEVTVQTRPVAETKEVTDTTRREELRVEKKDKADVEEIPRDRRAA